MTLLDFVTNADDLDAFDVEESTAILDIARARGVLS